MSWKMVTKMSERKRFIELVNLGGVNISQLCKEFGITRPTGYALLKRYKEEGDAAFQERTRRPKNSPLRTKKEVEDLVLWVRSSHPKWAGAKIEHYLKKQGHKEVPSEKTIDRILKRYGCINAEESAKHKPFIRFEHEKPNDLWQMDFKGHFELKTGGRCHPLTLLDDHSRYSLLIKACANEQGVTVKSALKELFREYGLPVRMTMDNGPPWGYSRDQRPTELGVWLMQLGIRVSHSRPFHPQTQGKLERFHRTLKLELLGEYYFDDLLLAQAGFDWWRKIYNEERPHEGIGHEMPKERYCRSERKYPEELPVIEYGGGLLVRKVQSKGEIYYKGTPYRVGKAFHGYPVGLKEDEEKGLLDVYFCQQKVLTIDLKAISN